MNGLKLQYLQYSEIVKHLFINSLVKIFGSWLLTLLLLLLGNLLIAAWLDP
jgi:hypothetical protein